MLEIFKDSVADHCVWPGCFGNPKKGTDVCTSKAIHSDIQFAMGWSNSEIDHWIANRRRDYSKGVRLDQQVYDKMKKDLKQDLKKTFNPEFLNRISEVVVFNPLNMEGILEILEIQLEEVNQQLIEQGLTLDMTDDAKKWLAEKGYDKNFGARPLKRAIQKHVEDVISDQMLSG